MPGILRSCCLLIALSISISASTQTVLLEELFDDSTLGTFTAYSVIGDGQFWNARDFGGKFFAQMNGFDGGIQDNEDWLISPAIDLDQFEDEILFFENASNFDGPELEVFISTDYDGTSDPNTATWTDLSDEANWSPGGFEYVDSGELDLSSFSGTGYVAFKYISNQDVLGKLWQIDSVVVYTNEVNTSVQEIENEKIISNLAVFNEYLEFTVTKASMEWRFDIYNTEGSSLPAFQNMLLPSGKVSLSIIDLPRGLYILSASSGTQIKSYKFIK